MTTQTFAEKMSAAKLEPCVVRIESIVKKLMARSPNESLARSFHALGTAYRECGAPALPVLEPSSLKEFLDDYEFGDFNWTAARFKLFEALGYMPPDISDKN